MSDPAADPCECRPGYECPHCDQQARREAEHRAEERRAEKLRSDE